MFRFLLRLTRDPSDADDLLQDTFLALWRRRDAVELQGGGLGLLRQTGYRLYLNSQKSGRRRLELHRASAQNGQHEPVDVEVEREDAQAFLQARVADAIERLPEPVRIAFVLHRFEGLVAREIAEATGVPVKTIETRIRRGVGLVAERMRPYRRLLPVRSR